MFKKIIDQVIETSRTDFEENGIDASVLASLQEVRGIPLSYHGTQASLSIPKRRNKNATALSVHDIAIQADTPQASSWTRLAP